MLKNRLVKCYKNVKFILTHTFGFNIMQVLGKLRIFGKRRVPYAVDTGVFSKGFAPDEIVGKARFCSGSFMCDCGSGSVITDFGIF